jgi:transposase, IS30 family
MSVMKNNETKFKYLSDGERSEIEMLRSKGYSIRSIAKVLRRSPNTISYEIKRVPSGYRADYAKQYARTSLKDRRYQWLKIETKPLLRQYIMQSLKKHWNPDEISGKLKKDKSYSYVSKSTIYKWLKTIYGERYKQYLYSQRVCRKKRSSNSKCNIPNMISIEKRPKYIDKRKGYGHWESDLIVSSRGSSGGISTHIERKSRFLCAIKVTDLTASEKQKTLVRLTQEFSVKSITFDRGHENVKHHELGISTFFCNPYHSWEKGSVENGNKMIRRYLPKRTDLSKITQEELDRIVAIINDKPRKILGYRSAREVVEANGIIKKLSTQVS